MCHYQVIHAAFHYELLNFDTAEQERHICEHKISSKESEVVSGEKCPLHSCCRVLGREVVFRCQDFKKDGEDGEETCESALIEDVFIPLKTERSESQSITKKRGDAEFHQDKQLQQNQEQIFPDMSGAGADVSPPTMEFWFEDQPGRMVVVYLEDEVLQELQHGGEGERSGLLYLWDRMAHSLR
ncbi:hypothetical protein F4819DRAFT_483759 [Hypoxylon fuscum]|nr:hypothetical protein F4819DRAFT_483759 [Hypoxylon fuscum]